MDETERTNAFASMSGQVSRAASAAKTLADFPTSPDAAPLKADTIRNLAREMENRLASISRVPQEEATPELFAEAARTCGDLATLAACNRDVFRHDCDTDRIVGAASEAAQEIQDSLLPDLEADESAASAFLLRDIRGAVWKASLAKDRTR